MDKLERYLDEVCRGVAGPRSLRHHIRQELREHLRDAIAEHRTAGLPEDAAVERALEDFGGTEQVRSELEATHGHRLMAVVIDKAMQWKEHTMRSKWLWNAFAHVMLQLTVAAQITLLGFVSIFILPKQFQLLRDVLPDANASKLNDAIGWSNRVLSNLSNVFNYFPWIVLTSLVITILFEWRVRTEHKSFIRLATLGALVLGLMIEIGCVMAALVLPWLILVPGMQAQPTEYELARHRTNLAASAEAFRWLLEKDTLESADIGAVDYHARRASAAIKPLHLTNTDLAPALKNLHHAVDAAEMDESDSYNQQRLTDAIRKFLDAYARSPNGLPPPGETPVQEKIQSIRDAFAPDHAATSRPSTQPARQP